MTTPTATADPFTQLAAQIRTHLAARLTLAEFEAEDESEQHRGHGGFREGVPTHLHLAIRAPEFKAMSRIERHRAVHAALGPELIGRIHALRLTLEA